MSRQNTRVGHHVCRTSKFELGNSFAEELRDTAKYIATRGKGILASDESNATTGKRLASVGVDNTEDNRRAWRECLYTAPGLGQYISGVATCKCQQFLECKSTVPMFTMPLMESMATLRVMPEHVLAIGVMLDRCQVSQAVPDLCSSVCLP